MNWFSGDLHVKLSNGTALALHDVRFDPMSIKRALDERVRPGMVIELMYHPYATSVEIPDEHKGKTLVKTDCYPNDRNAVSVHQVWTAATREELEAEAATQSERYHPAGYGTRLHSIKQMANGTWQGIFYRSLSCE